MSQTEGRFAQLRQARVAIAADELCFTRVLSKYLLDHGVFAGCDAYRRGRDLLFNLQEGKSYPVIVIDEQIFDQTAEEFVKALAALELEHRPAVFVLARYRYLELSERLAPYRNVRCLSRMSDPDRLVQAIRGWSDSFAAHLPNLCMDYCRQWGVQDRRRDCAYLADAVAIVLEHRGSNLLRKQVFADVASRRGVELSAVDSALQRMIRAMTKQPADAYLAFLQRQGMHPDHVTPIRLIYALAAELYEQKEKLRD